MEVTSGHGNASNSGYASQLNIRGAMALHPLLVLETLLAARTRHHHVAHLLLLIPVTLHHVDLGNVILVNAY